MTLIIIIIITLSIKSAVALDNHAIIKNIYTNETTTLNKILKKIESLSLTVNSKRDKFEDINTYQKRISSAQKQLSTFLKNQYRTKSYSGKISLDWNNSALIYFESFPFKILRKRGEESSSLKIVIQFEDPLRAREIATFSDKVLCEISFQMISSELMVISDLSIKYRSKEIYRE
jgi:hypothetical protein